MLRSGLPNGYSSTQDSPQSDSGNYSASDAVPVQKILENDNAVDFLPAENPVNWLLMLDVDGTLLDIAHRPDAVVVPLALKQALLKLYDALSGAVVLVSGRSIAELDALFFPLRLPVVGLHGAEQRINEKTIRRQVPDHKEKLAWLKAECLNFANGLSRVLVEQKPLSIALHYRMNPDVAAEVSTKADALAQELGWTVLHGKMVCEIQPAGFGKGAAVEKLCAQFAERKPVYAGDDVTDESALAVVKALQGYAIKVGTHVAHGYLTANTPEQVRGWLTQLADYGSLYSNKQPLQPELGSAMARILQPRPQGNTDVGRILVVSNRVTLPREQKSNTGGLAVAMDAVLHAHGGVWIGWSGQISDQVAPQVQQEGNISYMVQDLSKEDHDKFYMEFCNGALWPLLHYNIELSDFDRGAYETYQEVNRRYAEMLKATVKPNDVIWIHDFHFIPLAQQLRRLGVTNRIGFFLHTPFPTREVLLTLPVHQELMAALHAYDVVGFQTQRDLDAFHSYAGGRNFSNMGKEFQVNTVFGHFPIGIETEQFAQYSVKSQRSKEARDLRSSLSGRQLIVGVDRLDYSKGIPQRLKAIDDVLSRDNGYWQKQFTFLQISPPTREGLKEYADLRGEVESTVGHINGKYTHVDWVPIRFLARGIGREHLAAFYRMARIGLVTPLRDGMNLIAKEYVAAQDPENPGVLILSRFAGAAEEMREALLVNPHDTDGIADAIVQALRMPLSERKERWQALYATIAKQTLEKWYRDYLDVLVGER